MPPPDKVFLEFFRDELSSRPAVFSSCAQNSKTHLKYQKTTLPTPALLPHNPPATHRRFALPQHSALIAFIPDV